MSRAARYAYTSDVTENARSTANGYGGLKRAASATVVVSDLRFAAWEPAPFSRSTYIEAYGLSPDATILNASCDYNAAIAAGQFVTVDGVPHRILGANPVRGKAGATVALALVLHRVGGVA